MKILNEIIWDEDIKKYIEDESFIKKIDELVEKQEDDCYSVLNICRDKMNEFAKNNPPKDWLGYVYQFAIKKAFGDGVETTKTDDRERACRFYLNILRKVLNHTFLTEKEEEQIEGIEEYKRFKDAFCNDYIYEIMKLDQDINKNNTIDFIKKVHKLALFIGRQLKEIEVPLDLGRVFGATLGYQIGNLRNVHNQEIKGSKIYKYYTDEWFRKHSIIYIRNIAVNHSTWDLDIENLSLESMLMSYCHFKVMDKNDRVEICELEEVFLMNVKKFDQNKEDYCKAYKKLKDFENYMRSLGVDIDLEEKPKSIHKKANRNHYSLMQGNEIIENIKYLALEYSIHLMHKFRDETSLNAALESARSEEESSSFWEYIRAFERYSIYLTQNQKMIIINFLYEQLINHEDEDIRKKCTCLIGYVIAKFDEDYIKDIKRNIDISIPRIDSCRVLEKYLQLFMKPDPQISEEHRSYLIGSVSGMMEALFLNCSQIQINDYMDILIKYYKTNDIKNHRKYLLETVKCIPLDHCKDGYVNRIIDFIDHILDTEDDELRLHTIETINYLLDKFSEWEKIRKLFKGIIEKQEYRTDHEVENFLMLKISEKVELSDEIIKTYRKYYEENKNKGSDLFLLNLKTSTEKAAKQVQIHVLKMYAVNNLEVFGLQTAMHYCNVIKVTPYESIRNQAGEALLHILSLMTHEEREDVMVELLRGLEVEGYQFAKHIPKYLGKLMLLLNPNRFDDALKHIEKKIKKSNAHLYVLYLKTIGVVVENYYKYTDLFKEEQEYYHRLIKMLGILQKGLVHYNAQVKQSAFCIIGGGIFGSRNMDLRKKKEIFKILAKKLLTLIGDEKDEKLSTFFTHVSGLDYIYKFISDYVVHEGELGLKIQDKIAFFPGTFDPFSLGHKEIAKEIRSLGFEVYLAVDEFSWSKKTQPHLMRREVIKMAIADEAEIYLMPEDSITNIANNRDLGRLRKYFPYSDVHIVVGSDVILNASAYRKERKENSIHSFSHVVFERKSALSLEDDDKKMDEAIKNIDNRVIRLTLPAQYEDISSTQIRNNIDENRDISKLIDPISQEFIYEKGLYRREPQYKTLMNRRTVSIEVVRRLTSEILEELLNVSFMTFDGARERLLEHFKKLNPRILVLRSIDKNGEIFGLSIFHGLRSSMIFKEFQDENISEHIRRHSIGRMLVIEGIFVNDQAVFNNLEQMILTETIAYALPKDYTYGIYKNDSRKETSNKVYEVLECQGFERIESGNKMVFVVNMTEPTTLYLNIKRTIKEPFRSNKKVLEAIEYTRKRLQKTITKLYPGHLVLSFDRNMIYENLIKKICDENGVSAIPTVPRKLGTDICTPFGEILNGITIPNTVTKSMHTEKVFNRDMGEFHITSYPNYLDIYNQVKMIGSFNRPVILVDDLLNKGYRFKVVDPILKEQNIHVKKIIVGILSGRGKELMDMQNREIDCAYFIPKLKVWFNESLLYPFIGGDSLWRDDDLKTNLLPSINLILPYAVPRFIRGASSDAIYNFSETCIENTIHILETLEEEYQKINAKSLTIRHLGEVFSAARYPDYGKDVHCDVNLNPSHYVKNDLEHLRRLKL